MPRNRSRFTSWLASGLLALSLVCCPYARAQDDNPPAEGESKGRPLDGYIATGLLCGLALFIVGKTARR
jgi:hypothetical protein